MTWKNAKKILLVRLDNLGDVLMSTPAFRALKETFPGAKLTLLTSHMGSGIAPFIPEIDEVIEFDVPWVRVKGAQAGDAVLELVSRLKAEQFDGAILFTVFSQNPLPAALICYMAGIPLRLAYCREHPHDLLTDWIPDTEPFSDIIHEVQRHLHMVATIGAATTNTQLSLRVVPEMQTSALAKAGINPQQPWLILHPGVSEVKRQYPAEGYIEAGKALAREGFGIVVTGSASERALTKQVADAVGGRALGGDLSLGEFIGLVDAAPLLISNNTGPVHIAAAVGTPVVVLYAHTNPQHTPWKVPHRVLYFDVPENLRSRSPILTYTYQKTVPQPVHDATPQDIIRAALDLLAVQEKTV
jgi:lipopolysaccharide heptosyltransferase II